MSGVYFVLGKLGAGKGIYAAKQVQKYVNNDRRIVLNYDFDTAVTNKNKAYPVTRIPDLVKVEHLDLLGSGFNEDMQPGLLVLDECASWLNSRDFRAKGRLQLLDWFRHARKHGWTVLILVQDIDSLDKQLVNSLAEHTVELSRTDKLRIPVLSEIFDLIRLVKKKKSDKSLLPHYCKAATYLGKSKLSRTLINTEMYKPQDFFGSYDTNHIFSDGQEFINGAFRDMSAMYTCLPSNYFEIKSKQKNEQPIQETSTKKPFYLSKTAIGLICCFAYLGYTFAKDEPTQTKTQTDKKNEQKSTTEESKENLTDYKIPNIYINGSVKRNHGIEISYSYSFTNGQSIIQPSDAGYAIQFVNNCHAILIKKSYTQDVYCSYIKNVDSPMALREQPSSEGT